MRKFLSLLMAMMCGVSMFAMTITMPASTLDLQEPTMVTTAGWNGESAYYLDDDVLIVSGQESRLSVANQTWITFLSTGSSNSTWDALAPFKGSDYYTNQAYATLQAGRYTAYLVTGCDSVWVYGYNNAATKYLAMNIYDVTESTATSIDDASVTATYAVDLSAAGAKGTGVMKQALDASKKYLVVTTGTGASNSRVFEVAFFRHQQAPGPGETTKTVYCNMVHGWWTVNDAAVAVHYWGGTSDATTWPGVRMAPVEGENGTWSYDVPADITGLQFVRVNGSSDIADWGAKTEDLTLPTDGKNLFTITNESAVWGAPGCTGVWSVYTPAQPAEDITFYLVNNQGWENPKAFVFNASSSETAWPGTAMTETESTVGTFKVYSYTFKDNFTSIIFNNGAAEGAIQTVDLAWDATKPYFVPGKTNAEGKFEGTWYASLADIPAPAVPLEGNIWKATAEAPVIAGSHYIDEALLKMDGVYATTLKANVRTIAGEEFTHAIQVRANSYPSATDVIGPEKAGSTPLVITAKEDVEVTFYYNRQAVNESGEENDYKDLIVVDQSAPTTKLTGVFTIDQILEGNNYLNATKKLVLKKDHVYTVTAAGTTIQLHGVKLEAPKAHYFIAGTMNDWTIGASELLAGNGDSLSLAIALEADSVYEFKVVKVLGNDTAWFGMQEAATMVYGNCTGWWLYKSEGEFNQANVGLQTTKAGEYLFIFEANEHNMISVVIPEPAPYIPVLANGFYLVGKFSGVDAWSVEDLSAEKLFETNTQSEVEEYLLNVNLAVGDSIKIVYVENDAIVTWFPNEGGNYGIDDHHNGETTIYFRPNYNGGDDWFAACIYVVPTSHTDIDNVNAGVETVKVLRNGQLLIIKGEKTYTIMGQVVK